jgi:SAM-dependent methyltransferase
MERPPPAVRLARVPGRPERWAAAPRCAAKEQRMSDEQYSRLWSHRLMLRDRERNARFREAIARAVRPGDVVLDVGAGTGVLSLFAAQAGARKVYAVERTSIARFAALLVERNGFGDVVEVLETDVADAWLPEPVDVLVSEWLGGYGVDENLLGPTLLARDRWLRPGGRIVPARVTAWLAPAWDWRLDQERLYWRGCGHGLDLSPVAEHAMHEPRFQRHHLGPGSLAASPRPLWTTDAYGTTADAARAGFRASASFAALRTGGLNCLAAWFHAELDEAVGLTNAPDAPPTHWGRWAFPMNRPVAVEEGQPIEAELACEPQGVGTSRQRWSVRIAGGDWEHHDTSLAPF